MPEIALAKVNPEAPFEAACLFACGLSAGLGAAMYAAAVREGSTCVVFGAGMVGLGATDTWVARPGTVAGVAGKRETLAVIPRWLIQGRRIAGSSFGGVRGRDKVPELVDRYLAGEIDVDAFISHRIALEDVNHAFALMEAQDGIRSVIQFG